MSHSSLFLVLVSTQCFASQQLHHWNYYGLLLPWAAQKNRLIGGRLKEDNEVPVKSLEAYCIPLAASVNLYSKIIHFWQLLFLIFCISDRTTSTRPNSSPVQIFICTQMHVGWGYIEIALLAPSLSSPYIRVMFVWWERVVASARTLLLQNPWTPVAALSEGGDKPRLPWWQCGRSQNAQHADDVTMEWREPAY